MNVYSLCLQNLAYVLRHVFSQHGIDPATTLVLHHMLELVQHPHQVVPIVKIYLAREVNSIAIRNGGAMTRINASSEPDGTKIDLVEWLDVPYKGIRERSPVHTCLLVEGGEIIPHYCAQLLVRRSGKNLSWARLRVGDTFLQFLTRHSWKARTAFAERPPGCEGVSWNFKWDFLTFCFSSLAHWIVSPNFAFSKSGN